MTSLANSLGTTGRETALSMHKRPHDAQRASFASHGLFTFDNELMEFIMIRTLLATTAVAALLTTGAIAQNATPTTPAQNPAAPAVEGVNNAADAAAEAAKNAAEATKDAAAGAANAVSQGAENAANATKDAAANANAAVHDMTARPVWDISAGYTAADTDNLGTRLIDQSVYSSTADDAEDIGKITDIVFSNDGTITAVIIGVGGFLGMGEKSVAVDFRSLEFTVAADNTERWVLPTTADALKAAPDFVWLEDEPGEAPKVQ
jgi:predicted ribonuclease toxin of YeeF-YezG toxin-antitoxin module